MEEEDSGVAGANIHGNVCFRKIRKKRQKALIKEMMYDYATNTTLHGLPYTTRRGFTVVEKVFWLVTFISSICFCIYLINNTWVKWWTSPVMVTISEKLVPVGEVPFPSVTICPQLKVKKSVYDYAAVEKQLTKALDEPLEFFDEHTILSETLVKFDDISNVCCDRRLYQNLADNAFDIIPVLADIIKTIVIRNSSYQPPMHHNIIRVAPKKEDIFVSCIWRNQNDIHCNQTMTEVITTEGLCYNVNSLSAHEILSENSSSFYFKADKEKSNWDIINGYTSKESDVYPVAGKAFGASPDLEIIFRDDWAEHGDGCDSMNRGFNKVFIQHPTDLPQSSLYFYAVRNDEMSSMALSFSKIKTAKAAKKYSTEIRQCYFPDEIKLKYFKEYTASNCMIECLANITRDKCQCVGFYMPRGNDTNICSFAEWQCLLEAREEFVMREARENNQTCHCLPSCYAIDYQAEILKTPFDFKKFAAYYNLSIEENVSYSKLEMFYKGPRFVSMHRSEMFGPTDFIANIGGLLSLFLGFSFLSFIELFYYLTLRLYCTLRKDLKQEKKNRMSVMINKPHKF